MTEERKPFKEWMNEDLVRTLAVGIAGTNASFDADTFVRISLDGLDRLELLDRVNHIADALHAAFPVPTREALRSIERALPPVAATADGITQHGFGLWPLGEFIARWCGDDPDAAFDAMIALTQRFSAEFAVRPFLSSDPDGALRRLETLVDHPSLHVRRWVSEGTRTRLPWARRIPALLDHTERRIALLERLRHDPERYVQRSVANHLQDILRDDRDRGLDVLRRWAGDAHPGTRWIVRHAARGLLKAGDPDVLALFGLGTARVAFLRIAATPPILTIGSEVRVDLDLRNDDVQPVDLRLDMRMEAPGARTTPVRKVFRWTDLALAPGERATRSFRHRFVTRTIRAVRPGLHRFTVQCNGVDGPSVEVRVVEPGDPEQGTDTTSP